MPHVIVKLWPGKSEQQKRRLAEAITKDIATVLNYGDESVSVVMEEVDATEWAERSISPTSFAIDRSGTRNRDTGCEYSNDASSGQTRSRLRSHSPAGER
jgi:4-oxalocrotonate tautomerase